MRYVWPAFLFLVILVLGWSVYQRWQPAPAALVSREAAEGAATPVQATAHLTPGATRPLPQNTAAAAKARVPAPKTAPPAAQGRPAAAPAPSALPAAGFLAGRPKADSVVAFALRQLGTNYCYAGATPAIGFDCSGFIMYVFARYHVAVPHATALLIDAGRPVPRAQARPGDIVVFTGTAKTSTTPGHAGIVLTQPGEPIRFVHSSSARRESGVKISQVEGTDYERRFMQIRRVL